MTLQVGNEANQIGNPLYPNSQLLQGLLIVDFVKCNPQVSCELFVSGIVLGLVEMKDRNLMT